jgi:hypothetical protein
MHLALEHHHAALVDLLQRLPDAYLASPTATITIGRH